MGLLPVTGSDLNDILILTENNILARRLQTVVFEKGLSSTIKQARQMISHGHIHINGHRVTVPGYIVSREEEASVTYNDASPFTDEMHPMRISPEQAAINAAAKAEVKEKTEKEAAAKAKADAEEAGITLEDGEI
ncbi:MAG: 30S ribosomal protein S4, partial [Candidatus Methanoplasma sp.]|jgi:small subunit ribosomal protein S4|nr:30S ribosomal protein S4 [Candidatus Methanoplasma sp.]